MPKPSHRPVHWLLVAVNGILLLATLWFQPPGFRIVLYDLVALINIVLFACLALNKH